MGKRTKKEISLLDEIIDEITLEFFSQSEDIREKDKLVFSVCNNDSERQKYIFDAIEEMQSSIKKSPAKIAAYLTGIQIQLPEIKDRFEKRFEQALINLILNDHIEAFDELMQNKKSVDSYVQYFNQYYEYKEEWRMLERLLQYSLILNRLEIFNELKGLGFQEVENKTEQNAIEIKPIVKPEAVQAVFDILKDFFSPENQNEFRKVIETGNNASNKLLFKGSGNRLTDTFKKLIEHDFITGCQKQDLIRWIISNFTFTQQNKAKAFIYDTVEKTISRNYYPCKSPLIEIKNGQIQRVEQPRKRKKSNY